MPTTKNMNNWKSPIYQLSINKNSYHMYSSNIFLIVCDKNEYISSVYSPFSDGVGLPLHNIPSSGVLMKSIGAEFL